MHRINCWLIALFIVITTGCKKNDNKDDGETVGKMTGKIILPSGSPIDVNSLNVVSSVGLSPVTNGIYSIDTTKNIYSIQFAVDPNGAPMLMRYNYPNQPTTDITPQTTALAMFMSLPLTQTLAPNAKAAIISRIIPTAEFSTLVDEISNSLKAGKSFADGSSTALNSALINLLSKAPTLRISNTTGIIDEPIKFQRAAREISLVNNGVATSYAVGLYKDGQRVGPIQVIGGYDLMPTSLTEAIAHIYALTTSSAVAEPSEVRYTLQGEGRFEIKLTSGKPGQNNNLEEANKAFNYNATKGVISLISNYFPLIDFKKQDGCSKAFLDKIASYIGVTYSLATTDGSSAAKLAKLVVDIAISTLTSSTDLISKCTTEKFESKYFAAVVKFLTFINNYVFLATSTYNTGAFAYHWYAARPLIDTCFSVVGNNVTPCQDTFTYNARYWVPGTMTNHTMTLKLNFNNGVVTGRGRITNYEFWGTVTGSVNGTTLNLIFDYQGVTPYCQSLIPQPPPNCPACIQGGDGRPQTWTITGIVNSDHSTFNGTYLRKQKSISLIVNANCSTSLITQTLPDENGLFSY